MAICGGGEGFIGCLSFLLGGKGFSSSIDSEEEILLVGWLWKGLGYVLV